MPASTVAEVLTLLEKANKMGVRLSLADDELVLSISKGKAVDASLIAELRANKPDLLEYFKMYKKPQLDQRILQEEDFKPVEHNGKRYWEVIPFLVYWLDEQNTEYKGRLQCRVLRRISGHFDLFAFRKAIAYLICRHESLRASFAKIGDKYFTAIAEADSQLYGVDFRDVRPGGPEHDIPLNQLLYFEGHKFELSNGPLFLVRIIQTGDEEYLLTIKLHHAIYDGWSLDVLLRDVAIAYNAFTGGKEPVLPELKFQYKDYMYFKNRLIRNNYTLQQQYWQSLYAGLPGELAIPGAKKVPEVQEFRNAKLTCYYLSAEIIAKLNTLSGKYDTSLFIILQAAFKLYLSAITGQHDIVIGTMSFGRDELPGIEDQIGYYAYTDLVRTVLDKSDSFGDVVTKVKKSNKDMKENNICTLISHLIDLLPPGKAINTTDFWKINLGYSDGFGFYLDVTGKNDLSPEGIVIRYVPGVFEDTGTDLDIKIQFQNFRHRMEIAVQYDCDIYDGVVIDTLLNDYLTYLRENLPN
jgi:NRPS condensation-like uncharacterized protein